MKGKMRWERWTVACLLGVCLAGCLGKAPPVERYLRVKVDNGPCQTLENAQRWPLAMKPLTALDNLDRTAVLTAQDRVLTPSLQFYWEGSPLDIVGQALRQGIECQSAKFAPVDYQPRMPREGVLTGQISAFNVEETNGGRFVVSLHLELWTKNSGFRASVGDFHAYAPLENFEGSSVALAASDALRRVIPQVTAWLDAGQEKLQKANHP